MTKISYFMKMYVMTNLIVLNLCHKYLYIFIETWLNFRKFDLEQNQNNLSSGLEGVVLWDQFPENLCTYSAFTVLIYFSVR